MLKLRKKKHPALGSNLKELYYLKAVFQSSYVVWIRELTYFKVVFLFHVLDPIRRLLLWINHQRPPIGIVDNNGVINGRAERTSKTNFKISRLRFIRKLL